MGTTMTVKECVDNWTTMSDAQRELFGRELIRHLTPVTLKSLREFQSTWDPKKPFPEFLEAQHKELSEYLKIEIDTVLGRDVREILGLTPLSWDDLLAPADKPAEQKPAGA